jgi:tetratricopeptide (TPR) repeat protein
LNGQALVYSTYGVYYGRFGQADKAIYYFNEAFKLKETLKDNEGAAKIAENLSALYRINGQFDLAVKFAEFRIAEHLRQSKTAAAANMHLIIAQLKLAQKKFKQSEYNVLNKAFPLFKRTGSKFGRMRCFQTLAEIYFEQGRYSEAKWFYIQAQIMSAKIFDNQAMISSLIGLGKTKHAQGDYLEALQDYKQAEELALRNNYLVNLVEINAGLGETYNKRGDYQAADAALNEYHKFRESWIKANKL